MNATFFDITSDSYNEISIPQQYQNGIYPKEFINCIKVYDEYNNDKGKLTKYFPKPKNYLEYANTKTTMEKLLDHFDKFIFTHFETNIDE